MGIFRNLVSTGAEFFREEVMPLRGDLIKAGVLTPDRSAFEPKANLTDPTNYGAMNYGYREKWSLLDYSKLRQIAYSDPIVAAIIQVRVNQIASFCVPQPDKHKIGFKIVLRDPEKEPNGAAKKKIKELEQFIINTGVPESFEDTPEIKKRDNFETFLRKIGRDTLSFDQLNFEITPRRNGMPYSFNAVDASTIRLVPDAKEKEEFFGGPGSGYSTNEIINIFPSGGSQEKYNQNEVFKPKNPKYVQVVNGIIRHIFDEWEMAFGVRNPRTDLLAQGYGFSEIEMLVATITSHMNAESYNRKFFSQGSTIKGVMTFEGSVPPDQLEAFRRQWYMQSTGITNAWRTPIMSLGKETKLNWVDLHKNNKDMEYGKWLEYCIKTICGVYQIDPSEIGFDISKGTSGSGSSSSGGLSSDDHGSRILYSQEKGLTPVLRHIQGLLNEYIIWRIDPDFEFKFVGLGVTSEKDELDQAEKMVKNFKTVNEIRAEHDLPPIKPMTDVKSFGDIILDSGWVQALSGQLSMAAQDEMDGQNAEGGDQPPGEPTDDQGDFADEPDYDNMSSEELQAELDKLQGNQQSDKSGGEKQSAGDTTDKPFQKKAEEDKAPKKETAKKPPAIKKSELIL